ncbi:MAG TPA: tRNA (adenosine(37)-N6)-threonylcarbamoyltransferase complex dimerization subunit type 1 TsaB [Candidatus Binatia bacterium]|nr:tRNA (adenosine(37)-N6)-threonylcarbamoyltransferase complex dimerization subunit type 1 TsaB [Candidatus Binatia bacterium]
MIILTIRTDKPVSELGLFNNRQLLVQETWEAHRELAETIHLKIESLLKNQAKDWSDLAGIICYKGPGSFTGLRIGLSVGNALAYGLNIPIVGSSGTSWQSVGLKALAKGQDDKVVLPKYGSPVHITAAKK